MNAEKLSALQIDRAHKQRPTGTLWIIFIVVIVATLGAVYLARPKAGDDVRRLKPDANTAVGSSKSPATAGPAAGAAPASTATNTGREPTAGNVVLTVSGYIINRERIEISPRFMGVESDLAAVEKATTEEMPPVLDYLEKIAPESGFLIEDRLTLADIAVASPFANLIHCGFDFAKWPKAKAWADAILARPSFAAVIAKERAFLGG